MNRKFLVLTLIAAIGLMSKTACGSIPATFSPTPVSPSSSSSTPATYTSATRVNTPTPSPAIVGKWKLAGAVSEVGVSAGTTGTINGEHYLFIGTGSNGTPPESAIRILSLRDPVNPVEIGKLETDGKIIFSLIGLELSGTVLYASTLNFLWIIDVSTPSAPKEISRLPTQWSLNSAISGEYAYIIDNQKITVADVSNPSHPQQIGNWALSPLALKATDSLLLATTRDGLHIIDISSPQSLKEVGSLANPVGVAPENWDTLPLEQRDLFLDLEVAGKYAYIASGVSGLRVLDISNPAAPVEISQLKTQGVASRIHIDGNLAYLIDWRKPLTPENPLPMLVIDISDPQKPHEIASVEFPPYFSFNFVEANNYVYYFGNDPSIEIAGVFSSAK